MDALSPLIGDGTSAAPAVVFREIGRAEVANPAPGEVLIAPALAEDRDRRDLALLVLERGLGGLPRGEGEARRVVVQLDPTFDDLLAATITLRLLCGEPVPPGLGSFAQYAALAREGLKPGQVPMEVSLAGAFLAIRAADGDDLANPSMSRPFLARWSRLAAAIVRAAEAGVDPFTASLIAEGSEFARERAYLAGDRDVYRQDVARGERWWVRLPDGPPRAAGLLLRRPRSLLFKYWSREDPEAPQGRGFLFLAVDWGEGQWVFSTDPIHRLPIRTLADKLQAAEAAVDPERAARDPWFDGQPFRHTLVAAPRAGTRLSDKQVLRIVRASARARAVGRTSPWTPLVGSAALSLLVIACAVSRRINPPVVASQQTQAAWVPPSQPGEINLHVLTIGVSDYPPGMTDLPCAVEDARAIRDAFQELGRRAGGLFDRVHCREPLVDPDATTRDNIYDAIKRLVGELGGDDEDRRRLHRNDLAILYFAGHGRTEDGKFYFIPSNFEPSAKSIESSGVSWDLIKPKLEQIPCTVLVLMDTCQAGPITEGTIESPLGGYEPGARGLQSLDGTGADRDDDPQIGSVRVRFVKGPRTLVTLAAATSIANAYESPRWRHSAFALALLECITGTPRFDGGHETRRLLQGRGVLTLDKLHKYVDSRVRELTPLQPVVLKTSGNVDHRTIPITFVGGGALAGR